jgi:molybdopterin converting factor small subunit
MKTKLFLLVLVFTMTPALNAQQGASGSSYTNQPLADAIDRSIGKSEKKFDFLIDARQVKSKSKVSHTGEVRKVGEKKLRFLEIWLESRGLSPKVIELLQKEARFREGDKDYWLPVRKKILDDMAEQVKKGDEVVIHTILAGGVRQENLIEWVFVVGEFSKSH